jgi:hypothetical protein
MTALRQTVDLSAYPDLVVIYLGMRVNVLTGIKTLLVHRYPETNWFSAICTCATGKRQPLFGSGAVGSPRSG